MHPVHAGHAGLFEGNRSADIGGDHALFDQPVRIVALHGHDLGNTIAVEHDVGLAAAKVEGAPGIPGFPKTLIELVQRLQGPQHLVGRIERFAFQVAAHLLVGQPRPGLDQGVVEPVAADLAARRHAHVAHHRQAPLPGPQGTQPVGQRLGQHRDHPVRQVDRVAAQLPFLVEQAAGIDVVRHVCNRDDQPPAAAVGLGIDGVVEVLGGDAIDGNQRQRPQIFPALAERFVDFVGQRRNHLVHALRPFPRHFVAGEQRFGRLGRAPASRHACHQVALQAMTVLAGHPQAYGVAVLVVPAGDLAHVNAVPGAFAHGLDKGVPGVGSQDPQAQIRVGIRSLRRGSRRLRLDAGAARELIAAPAQLAQVAGAHEPFDNLQQRAPALALLSVQRLLQTDQGHGLFAHDSSAGSRVNPLRFGTGFGVSDRRAGFAGRICWGIRPRFSRQKNVLLRPSGPGLERGAGGPGSV